MLAYLLLILRGVNITFFIFPQPKNILDGKPVIPSM
jgi:hypothetical protein